VKRHLANLKRSAGRSSAAVTNLVACAALVVSLVGLAGCPGTLGFDPNAGGNPDGSIPMSCTTLDSVLTKCTASCHNPAGQATFADLDLMSDGVATRLVDVPATTGGTGMCSGKGNLLDKTTLPATGILIDKIKGTQTCGGRMPLGGSLSSAETDCLQAWANGLVASVP
jgi:hypothetical protein